MSKPNEAYPLTWPPGWKRTVSSRRKDAKFIKRDKSCIDVAAGVRRVLEELERLGVKEDAVVISTNIRPTLSGRSTGGIGQIDDPGVCVYWTTMTGDQRCIAVDMYKGVAGNLGAVAATLDALRAIERHGGAAILDRAFTGFVALPAPEQPFQVLGVGANATREQIEDAYRRLAMQHHPDRGGSESEMARINAARDTLLS